MSRTTTPQPAVSALRRALLSSTAVAAVTAALLTTSTAHAAADPAGVFDDARPGNCLSWTTGAPQDLSPVDCRSPHLFEVAAPVDLGIYPGTEFGEHATAPSATRYTELRDALCGPETAAYLGDKLDPVGRFSVGLVHPSTDAWNAGERTVLCGLQQTDADGTAFQPFTGTVATQDQSRVWPDGTCLARDPQGAPGDRVDCAKPHAMEIASTVDLATAFPAALPLTDQQDAYLAGMCTLAAQDYAGTPDALSDKSVGAVWADKSLASWYAGSRKVNCGIGNQLPNKTFAPVTGSVRQPAPAAGG